MALFTSCNMHPIYVYRVERYRGDGPIYGKKSVIMAPYDYRGTRLEACIRKRWEEFGYVDESDLFGVEEIVMSYDSRAHIIQHKTPRENMPYLKKDTGYKIPESYVFGWNTYKKCIHYVKPGKKHVLHNEGFGISTYLVNRNCLIRFRDGQIAFDIKKARRLSWERKFS